MPTTADSPATETTSGTTTMRALTVDVQRDPWDQTTGMVMRDVPRPTLDEASDPTDSEAVLIRVIYAGFCGSDRGIWWRKSFKDMIHDSLAMEGATTRTIGHEIAGEIVDAGRIAQQRWGMKPGRIVSTESHIICGKCYQCRLGDTHVCANDKIIGISTNGGFAEYIKLPASVLWPTDITKVRLEVAALQEPFGNAVHCCQVADLRGRTVVIVGTGTIGLFTVLAAKALGAACVIGLDPLPRHLEMAKKLGADEVIPIDLKRAPVDPSKPWKADPQLVKQVLELTRGRGADVAIEMAGSNQSLNNAIKMTRRGGTTILFGLRNDDFVIEDYHRVIMNGLKLHSVIGRRIFDTWTLTQSLLENPGTGIAQAIWDVILNGGDGPVVDFDSFEPAAFEKVLREWPKAVLRIGKP
ncbi:MAG: alcohol dehydrogenase catalytic domain-containing protein [Planctomycetota bacterium]